MHVDAHDGDDANMDAADRCIVLDDDADPVGVNADGLAKLARSMDNAGS